MREQERAGDLERVRQISWYFALNSDQSGMSETQLM